MFINVAYDLASGNDDDERAVFDGAHFQTEAASMHERQNSNIARWKDWWTLSCLIPSSNCSTARYFACVQSMVIRPVAGVDHQRWACRRRSGRSVLW